MSKTIWKFDVEITDRFFLQLPPDYRILKVAKQRMWIEGTFEGPHFGVTFTVVGTGHPVPAGFDYAGTFFDGPYVWHVYHWRVGHAENYHI